jgi:hypothetical protein
MQNTADIRWSGVALIGAGVAYALFWCLILPFGTLAGAHVVHESIWIPAQWFHVVGALFALFGLMGIYGRLHARHTWFGRISFVVAIVGITLFFVDGMFALVVFPAVADHAPSLLDATGGLSTGAVAIAYIVFAATNMIGNLLLGAAMWQSRLFPLGAVLLNMVGAILFNLPPGPIPLSILTSGGLLWGVSAIWLGGYLWRTSSVTS